MSHSSISGSGSPASPGRGVNPLTISGEFTATSTEVSSPTERAVRTPLGSYPVLHRPAEAPANWEQRLDAWSRGTAGGAASLGERLEAEVQTPVSPNRLITVLTRDANAQVERICRLGDALLLVSSETIGAGGEASVHPVARLALHDHQVFLKTDISASVLRSEVARVTRDDNSQPFAQAMLNVIAPLRFSLETHALAEEACPEGVVALRDWGVETGETREAVLFTMHQEMERAHMDLARFLSELQAPSSEAESNSMGESPSKVSLQDAASRYARELVQGIHHLHKAGIVHLDIKPQNILLCADEHNLLHAKWADFGCANQLAVLRRAASRQNTLEAVSSVEEAADRQALERAVPFPRTALYAPPEAFSTGFGESLDVDNPIMGKQYDVFAVGIVLWQLGASSWPDSLAHRLGCSLGRLMLTGGPIKPEQHIAMVNRVLSDATLRDNPAVLTACLCLNPSRSQRPANGSAVAALFDKATKSPVILQRRLRRMVRMSAKQPAV